MMRSRLVPLLLVLAACGDDFKYKLQLADMYPLLTTGTTDPTTGTTEAIEPTTGTPGTTGAAASTSGQASTGSSGAETGDAVTGGEETGSASTADATGTSTTTTTGGASTVAASDTGGEPLPPEVLAIDVPPKVTVAGPVPFTATTKHAASVHASLDGVDLGPLTHEGGGIYAGTLAIYGWVDVGNHVLEVTAENGGLSDSLAVVFAVDTPAPGTPAWAMSGPAGSRTVRIAVTPEGDVIEVGRLVSGGVPRPSIRKRSGITGAELWPEGTILLDDREGEAVDVAVTPDGKLWVAMNVREAANKWRPRIVLLDPSGHDTGIEAPTESGQTVTGIDHDGAGGCFASGFAGTGFGDLDVMVWRMTGAGVPVFSGKTWDYVPPLDNFPPHSFTDIATDVAVRDGIAWVVGMSYGKHDGLLPMYTRGLIVRMEVDTGAVLGPATIAPNADPWTQSMWYGAAAHPSGVLVTGTGCNDTCDEQRVETALYTAEGSRVWFRPEKSAAIARGNAVAVGKHDVVVVAATVKEGAALRGHVYGRLLYGNGELFNAPFPANNEPSEATGVAVGPFDRIYGAGYRTFGGIQEARVVHLHP